MTQAGSVIDAAAKRHARLFAASIVVLVVTALVIALFTWLVWDSGNKLQDAIQADASARIEEAKSTAARADERSKNLEHDNLLLRKDLSAESGKVAGLQKDATDAKASQQKVEIELAKQQERAATAERALLRLKESLKDRTISPEQEKVLITALTGAPSGPIEVWWTASDTDSFGLAKQMVEIFKKSGWPDATERFAAGGTGNGFFIAVHDHMNAPACAVSIQNAYRLIGIDMNGFSKPDIPEGKVQIYIGHKIPAP